MRHVVFGCAKNDLRLIAVAALTQQFQEIHPAHHGHVPVEQDHVGHLALATRQRFLAVAGFFDLELEGLKNMSSDLADHLGVIDD